MEALGERASEYLDPGLCHRDSFCHELGEVVRDQPSFREAFMVEHGAHARLALCGALLMAIGAEVSPTGSPVLSHGSSPSGVRGGWHFVSPWRERGLRVLVGEEETPADRVLQELGLLDDHVRAAGGWGPLLQLRMNGTEYMRDAVATHLIRSSAEGTDAQGTLFTALLGFLYTHTVVLPLVAAGVPDDTSGILSLSPGGDIESQVPSFAVAFPRAQSQISHETLRQRRRHETEGLGTRAQALACPFGRIETPLESDARRRREAWEDRLVPEPVARCLFLLLTRRYVTRHGNGELAEQS